KIAEKTICFPRYSRQIAGPLLCPHIVAEKFTTLLLTHDEKLFAILARQRRIVVQRPECQLYWLLTGPPENVCLFAHSPNIGCPIAGRLEDEISPVSRPIAATFGTSVVPARQQRVS